MLTRIALAAFLLLFVSACDVLDLFGPEPSDPNDRVAAGTILRIPGVDLPDGTNVIEPMADARLFFGERGAGADIFMSPPEPLTNASVTLTMVDDVVVDISMPHTEDGFYGVSSVEDEDLEYRAGATYRTTITEAGRIFEMDVEQVPSPEVPENVPSVHPRGQPMTLTWSQQRTALVEVFRLTLSGAIHTHSSIPKDVEEIVWLALQKEPEEPELEIPAEAFEESGSYVLVFIVLKKGIPDSSLFAGSSLMAGAGETVAFEVE